MAVDKVTRKLTMILAADVVGYSRLIRADEEGTLSALNSLRLRQAFLNSGHETQVFRQNGSLRRAPRPH